MFRNDKFPGFGHPYNLFKYFQNKGIDSNNTSQERQNTNISKNNRFSAEEAINYIHRTEKRRKLPVCEILGSLGSLSSPMLPILSWKLKILAYRGTSAIPPSSKDGAALSIRNGFLTLYCYKELHRR